METSTNRVVWLIEDSSEDANLYKRLLEAAGEITIQHVPVRPMVADYADLAGDPETGAVVIDERLGPYGGVDYTGLQVADLLRALRPELPIYILTQWPEDIDEDEGESTDSVFDKGTAIKGARVIVARIQRAMKKYEDSLTDQQKRLKELIDVRLAGDLHEDEEEELQQLRASIERPFAQTAFDQERIWDEGLRQQKQLLEELERIVKGIPHDTENRDA